MLFYGDCSSVGRASDCGSDGRGFEPRHSPHFLTLVKRLFGRGFLFFSQLVDLGHATWDMQSLSFWTQDKGLTTESRDQIVLQVPSRMSQVPN